MKIFAMMLLVIILSGCGAKNNDNAKEYNEKTSVPITAPDSEQYTQTEAVISEASTPLLDKSPQRVENINTACGAISGTQIYPGGVFAFNDTVGRRTEENGYGDASVIIDGHSEQGCGGGVCQVSTTIYMAALYASLQIDERHPHSTGVPYAPSDLDATVVYGEKDLIFTNNTDEILTLYVWCDGNNVFSKIMKKTLDKSA